jgi:hypothetical protein
LELAFQLGHSGVFSLSADEGLVLADIDTADFIEAALAENPQSKMQVLVKILSRYGLGLKIEGSLSIGQLSATDHSWVLLAGESGSFTIKVQPLVFRKTITDIVAFLSLLPKGQGFALKAGQDLLLEGLSSESMLAYYECCSATQDVALRDKGQDELFETNCPALKEKGLSLKIFGANASQVDRHIDKGVGGVFFHAVAKETANATTLVLVLLDKSA